MSENCKPNPVYAYANGVIHALSLKTWIRDFNSVGGGKLSSLSDFLISLDFKKELDAAYDAAREAWPPGTMEFDEAIRFFLEPIVLSTFLEAVPEEGRIWAHEIASSAPAEYGVEAPFPDEEAWVDWVMSTDYGPCTICGPNGEPVLEEEALDRLLRRSLRAERVTAMQAGWLQRSEVVRLVPHQGAQA